MDRVEVQKRWKLKLRKITTHGISGIFDLSGEVIEAKEVDEDTDENDWKMLMTRTTDTEWSNAPFRRKATFDQSG